jgi:ABC-type uncharacterized transport system substrate-binding protein
MMTSKVARSYFFQDSFQKLFKRSSSKQWDGKAFSRRKTVCIIRPNNSKEMSQMVQGIVSAIMDCVEHPHIIPVVGDNDINELTMLLYDVLYQHPTIDMIFSIGESSTKIAQKVTQDFGGNIPIFFIFVDEKTVSYVMKRNSNATGIVSPSRDYADQFKRFFHFTQHDTIKKVLVPCTRFAHGLGSAYRNEGSSDVIAFLESQKIEAGLITITCREDLHAKIKPLLSIVDLLAIPRDTVLEAYADELIAMANEQYIPLFSSSFESIEQGAAACFDSYDTMNLAKQNASLAKPILVHGIHSSKVPPVEVTNWVGTMAINREAAAQQGLKLNMERVCADQNVVLL